MRTTGPRGRLTLWVMTLVMLAVASPCYRCEASDAAASSTRLFLVGVGPGDPDLITLRALRTIKKADVIFCMRSIGTKFKECLEGKRVIHGYWRLFPYYGQDPSELQGEQRRQCEQIAKKRNEFITLVRRAIAEGKTVAIVDQGDPLIYGPWSWCLEEFEDLHPVVVPGLSCFNAGNAALGKSVTTGAHTKSVILTAADWPGKTDTIAKLSVHHTTMVLFTMKTDFKEFIDKLAINYPPDTPIAVVQYAGYAKKQQVIAATLGTILDRIDPASLPFEYLIYVGDFLTYRAKKAGRAGR